MISRSYLRSAAFALLALMLFSCTPQSERRVCFFGSSVCKGVGAQDEHGYAYMVGENLPKGWEYVNLSVSGNCTYDLFARYDRDMKPEQAKYVVIGLSLGNEGLHEKGFRAMLSYRENMPRLIKMLQEDGHTVIVANNYSRADFNEVDFRDLCIVNLEVQQWDVPTVNLFGNIDDGAGHWAEGFWNGEDIWHPNTEGHAQMASAFVPSMWEALDKGKTLPVRTDMDVTSTGVSELSFEAESGLCSYTLSYISDGICYAEVYSALRKECTRYADGQLLETYKDEPHGLLFEISGKNICQLLFYRAAMTPLEIAAIAEGKMLRSSLEIYCPLSNGNTHNLAQSMNNSVRTSALN